MSTRPQTARKAEGQITRQAVLDAAFALVEKDGLSGFSMRNLADILKVRAPTIYWHAGDKAEIIRLMANQIYQEARDGAPETTDWRQWLHGFGHAFRAALLRRRDSAQLCVMARPPMEDVESNAERISTALVDAGLDQTTALSRLASVLSFTLGWASYQQSEAMHDYLEKMIDFDASFAEGLDALINGFQQL